MKKYISVILSFILLLSLFGCGKNAGVPEDTESTQGVSETVGTAESEGESETSSESETDSSSQTEAPPVQSGSSTEKPSVSSAESTAQNKGKDKNKDSTTQTTLKDTVTGTTKAESTTEKVTVKPSPSPKKITCTVRADCSEIFKHQDKFKKDISALPQDGGVLPTTSVTVNEGATAYDVIKIACAQNGVELRESNSAFGKYIVGIGGVNEKDCGNTSGWMYKVNGQSPNVATDKYKLKNGDSIELSYVC